MPDNLLEIHGGKLSANSDSSAVSLFHGSLAESWFGGHQNVPITAIAC
jgi:hypothetical protein